MMSRRTTLCALLGLMGCVDSTTSQPPAPTGNMAGRTFSISANPRPVPTPGVAEYIAGLDTAIAAGTRGIVHTYTWSSLEPDSVRMSVRQMLDDMRYSRSRGLTTFLGIQVINTVKREVPGELTTTRWNSARMLARFERLLDAMGGDLQTVRYVSIGNEVGTYLSSTNEWADFTDFLRAARAAVQRRAPTVRVGTTLEWARTRDTDALPARALLAESDLAVFTWYPLGADWQINRADPVAAFSAMRTTASGRPIVLQELGYPAAAQNGSSEAAQATFFRQAIDAWRAIPAADMPMINLFLLHDLTPTACDELQAYYGLRTPRFAASLCSLGLRRSDGSPRPAWNAVVQSVR
jgi:hypothetical protein